MLSGHDYPVTLCYYRFCSGNQEKDIKRVINAEFRQKILDLSNKLKSDYDVDFFTFRKKLASIAKKFCAYPANDERSEWICFFDDDDIIVEIPDYVFQQPSDVVLVGWSTYLVSLVNQAKSYLRPINYIHGPFLGGYAIRRKWYASLTPEQKMLIATDHHNAHRYAHWSGYKYVFYPNIIGNYYLIHPISITGAQNGWNLDDLDMSLDVCFEIQHRSVLVYLEQCLNLYRDLKERKMQNDE